MHVDQLISKAKLLGIRPGRTHAGSTLLMYEDKVMGPSLKPSSLRFQPYVWYTPITSTVPISWEDYKLRNSEDEVVFMVRAAVELMTNESNTTS